MAALKLCINERLIDAYQSHACLWDTKSSTYHNKNMRLKALEEICGCLNLSGTEENIRCLKVKFKHMRTSFSKELRRKKASERSGIATEDAYIPKWLHFEQLRFLEPHCSSRPGKNNMEDASQELDGLFSDTVLAGNVDEEQDTPPLSSPDLLEENNQEGTSSLPSNQEGVSNISSTPKRCNVTSTGRKRHSSSPDSSLSDASASTILTAKNILADIAAKRKRDDSGEYYHFAMNLAKRLEKLTPLAALECTRQIDELVHSYLYANLHDTS